MNILKATKRTSASTGQVNKLRSDGFVPAVLYGGEKSNLNISLKKLITTDTINNLKKTRGSKKIEIISIAPMISEAMKRIANSTSVSSLFK